MSALHDAYMAPTGALTALALVRELGAMRSHLRLVESGGRLEFVNQVARQIRSDDTHEQFGVRPDEIDEFTSARFDLTAHVHYACSGASPDMPTGFDYPFPELALYWRLGPKPTRHELVARHSRPQSARTLAKTWDTR